MSHIKNYETHKSEERSWVEYEELLINRENSWSGIYQWDKGSTFLKKLWCCVGGRV